jgi:hypothetical protein
MRFKVLSLLTWCIPSLPKALQVLRHLFRQRQEPCVEAFDLIDRRPSVLSKVEDVHSPLAVDDPHTNRRMTQGAKPVDLESTCVGLDAILPQYLGECALQQLRWRRPTQILG